MPVLLFRPDRILNAVGAPLSSSMSISELLAYMESLKAEVSLLENGLIEAEIEVDRPDLYISEGFARAIRGLLGLEKGMPRYRIENSGIVVRVEDVPTRPFIGGAVIWDVNVDDVFLEELIQFQEKLHVSLGYRRKRFAIGLHDLDKMPSRELCYRSMHIDETRFVPLGHKRLLSLREVLEVTDQGKKYGRISLEKGERHPVLFSGDQVISMPPVINAENTRIEPGSRHIFVDVTGEEERAVNSIVDLIAFTLAERSASKRIGFVKIIYSGGEPREKYTPIGEKKKLVVRIGDIEKLLGLRLSAERAVELAMRARFNAEKISDGEFIVEVPPYRIDVIDWVDVAEDLLLMHGFSKLAAKKPKRMLRGGLLYSTAWERKAREVLLGLGFSEVYTFSMANCREQEEIGGVKRDRLVVIANPGHVYYDCMRATLIPALLHVAARNSEKPSLRIFEAGLTVTASHTGDTRVDERKKIGILIMDYKAGYEDIQAVVYALVRMLGDEISRVEPINRVPFIRGRSAYIETSQNISGVLGEVHPSVLERIGIMSPIALAEIDYTNVKPPSP